MTETQAPLTVYKASAGSGKTFTLAVEYIKLLVREPQNYRYILAVTFTNKATEEMKTRILGQLYGIANALPDSEDYMEQMRAAFPRMTDEAIRRRADEAMQLIIHHYNHFRVETIDSFFQSILRHLARELGLTANLQIGLNDQETESQAVDHIIENIQLDSDPLLSWIMDFVTEKMSEEKNWNVIGRIKEFGRNIFKDFYKTHQRELRRIMGEPDFFKAYTSRLHALKATAVKTMAGLASEYQDIVNRHGLCDSNFYQGGRNAPGYFAKLAKGQFVDDKIPNSYVAKGILDHTELVRKADAGTPEAQIIVGLVGPLLARAEEERKRQSIVVNSVDLTLKNLNELRLLGRIEEEVSRINTENNNYPLSNTQKLLSDLIDHQDSPFIYERTGSHLRYIMIDEFQDTSTIQWANFKVLLDDCLAHNNGSLIVGDVKQSIYRWRNGDWRLLQQLSPERDSRIRIRTLGTNYRSKRNIIRFNNAFFQAAAQATADEALAGLEQHGAATSLLQEAEDIRRAYADVAQQVSPGHQQEPGNVAGSVTIRLLPKTDYEENMVLEVKRTLEHLLSSGIPSRRIAILVRKNKHIQLLANYFQQNPLSVRGEETMASMVSDEAFRLDASLAVCTVVRAMHLLGHPDDRLATAALVKTYRKICNGEAEATDTHLFVGRDDLRALLPAELLDRWTELLTTPLIDLAEQLYRIFGLHRLTGQSAYMCAFFDQLSAFVQNRIAGIEEFVEEWESVISSKSIHCDDVDGIRLLTVHKSKGLEFDHVIIPYCDWEIEKSTDVLWVSPATAPYNDLPVVPVNLSAGRLQASIYAAEYQSEHLKNLTDNLNVLYVAFTRAERNLFVIGRKDDAQYPSALIGQVIGGGFGGMLPDHTVEEDADGITTFRLGTLCPSVERQKRETLNVFSQTEEGIAMHIRNYDVKASFRQSSGSQDFITPDDELQTQEQRREYIQTGNVLHSLFASIRNIDDVPRAIDRLEFDGVLYGQTMSREELHRIIDARLQSPQVAAWFAPHWQVLNECTILSIDPASGQVREQRPDRVIYDGRQLVVIDFKTGAERDAHHAQVRRYMQLLRDMGYPRVSGCLWYIRPNRVVPVSEANLFPPSNIDPA